MLDVADIAGEGGEHALEDWLSDEPAVSSTEGDGRF